MQQRYIKSHGYIKVNLFICFFTTLVKLVLAGTTGEIVNGQNRISSIISEFPIRSFNYYRLSES